MKHIKPTFVRSEGRLVRLKFEETTHVKSFGDYSGIYFGDKRHIVHFTLKGVLEKLPENFCRVHRSYILNVDLITRIEGKTAYVGNNQIIPISEEYWPGLKERINLITSKYENKATTVQ